ncbi:nuclear transport factor 2 family protein [Iamia majanohamensis]|uniref:Nuclear transport factor 2 family protein n=1 Tax=Iamia majanohamensis TaxID=467976 RepID=A0AAE9YC58_9ACTN|nr:nuclear transport factor 2 family protein [Iamia majanohamensis]WCO68493.1 nuclear transport factor 2 family protein [Iamia majanohamensis]
MPLTPDDLVEIHEITQLKHAYFRCLDQKRWEEMATLLVPEVEATYSGGANSFSGRDAVLDFLERSMGAETFHSAHHGHHPEITLLSPTEATGTWAMEDTVIMLDFDITIRGAGFYEDAYEKRDGRWVITRTGYKRLWEEMAPRGSVDGLTLTASWWRTDGVSSLTG